MEQGIKIKKLLMYDVPLVNNIIVFNKIQTTTLYLLDCFTKRFQTRQEIFTTVSTGI